MISGKNLTLLNVTYIRGNKHLDQKECFRVIYKTESGEVKYSDEPPLADIYIVKPEYRNYQYTKPQERIDHMDKITLKISEIRKEIARQSGEWGENIIRTAYSTNNFKLLDQLYKWPYAYGCDFQPEFYFYRKWYETHTIGIPKLTKAFMDIEVDLIDNRIDLSDIKNTAHAPVNLVSVVLDETREVYSFILKPYKPPLNASKERIAMYEKQLNDHIRLMQNPKEFIDQLHKDFDLVYGEFKYQLREYRNEIDLIADVFRLINTRKPNFCLTWNMRFDIQYLYYRIGNLGYNPDSIMCHPDFKNPTCYFKEDRSTFQLEKQFDFFYCSSYTQYICSMRLKYIMVSINSFNCWELSSRQSASKIQFNTV